MIKKHREVLVTCRQLANELVGDEWTLCELAGLSTENLWTWDKTDTTGYDGHPFLAQDKCVNFERELWFELGKCVWRKKWSIYQDHMKYIQNEIVKPLKFKNFCYAECVHEMHDLAKHLPPPPMKGGSAEADYWTVRKQKFTASEVQLEIKDGLPSSMQDNFEYHPECYHSLTYEYWCELLSTITVKDKRERASSQIKKIASARAASLSDSDKFLRIQRKKKARTGILCSNKPQKKAHKNHGI